MKKVISTHANVLILAAVILGAIGGITSVEDNSPWHRFMLVIGGFQIAVWSGVLLFSNKN